MYCVLLNSSPKYCVFATCYENPYSVLCNHDRNHDREGDQEDTCGTILLCAWLWQITYIAVRTGGGGQETGTSKRSLQQVMQQVEPHVDQVPNAALHFIVSAIFVVPGPRKWRLWFSIHNGVGLQGRWQAYTVRRCKPWLEVPHVAHAVEELPKHLHHSCHLVVQIIWDGTAQCTAECR
jgi:hypothetical protein